MGVRFQQYGFRLDPYDAILKTHPEEARIICKRCDHSIACAMDGVAKFSTDREHLLHGLHSNPDIVMVSDSVDSIIVDADPARINAYCRHYITSGGNEWP